MPAKAGTQGAQARCLRPWTPASAGATEKEDWEPSVWFAPLAWRDDDRYPTDRRPSARMAPTPPPQPARARLRRRHFDEASELYRNRPLIAEPRHGAASGRA